MRLKVLFIAVLAGLTVYTAAFAGTTGKIAGEVKDKQTGEPLVGASVVLAGTTYGAATNIEGYFTILNVPPGTYTISCSGVGFNKETVSGVKVSIDLTTTLDFALQSTSIEVGEVTVTAESRAVKRDLTSAEARVDAAQIASLPVREVGEVLSLQAGVTVDRGGGIHIRGGRTNEVAYWVDGVSVSDVYDGGQSVQIDNRSVQELQVISGTFNAEYGQAMSGIVNIVTKDGDQKYRASLSAYVGDYVTNDNIYYNLNTLRPLNNKNVEGSLSGPVGPVSDLTFYVSGRWFKSDGWLFGNRIFNTNGSLADSAHTINGPNGEFMGTERPNNPVPMNGSERFSGQAKLTYQISGSAKFALSFAGSRNDYKLYNHDWAWVPDADVNRFDRGYNVSGLWTHTLDAQSFYTINLSFFKKTYKEYLYQDPMDPRYNLDPTATNRNLDEFLHAGTNNHHFDRSTESRVLKIDYTNQISRLHQIKVGFEGKLHRLYLEDFNVIDTARVNGVLLYTDHIPDRNGPQYQQYTQQPREFSAYIQDKLEYDRMIVNVGLRYDYFNSRGQVLADPQDPNVYLPQKPEHKYVDVNGNGIEDAGDINTLQDRMSYWYRNASAHEMWSPRLGISYPITDRGILHFSYGYFLKIPSFSALYQSPGYKVDAVTPIQGVYGNADLKPERTVMYEIGLQQELSPVFSFDITGFYRDVRDWLTTSPAIAVRDPLTATVFYTTFINQDYANSRGITINLTKRQSDMFSVGLSYTFQIAEGNNSNPDEAQGALTSNREPEKALAPLEWDQTHTVNLNVGVGQDDWGVSVLGRYGSGLPYTPVINQSESRGEDVARVLQKNSRRQPATMTVDLRAFKSFRISPMDLTVYLRVFNLFDTRNEVVVYGETGRASASTTELGISGLGGLNRINTPEEFIVRPDFYSEPREIQFGIDLNF
jgi:outer membrane receptor protein involved in Fe transport